MNLIKIFVNFILDIWHNKFLLWELTKKDFKQRYLGSYLGILWAFIQPIITLLIFWFVFQVGFKATPVNNIPFIVWLVCGMVPWFFFSDAIITATNSILINSYLVKKIVFKVHLLPFIQIFSAAIIHIFFIIFIFVVEIYYGITFSVYNLQVIYYMFALICLVFGISLITSTLIIFLKDVGQIVSMLLQFGFWGTPIFWNLKMIPDMYQWIFKCNPMYYIVNGYRDAFINYQWFWELGYTTIGFWSFTLLLMIFGVFLHKKMRPHFADVL